MVKKRIVSVLIVLIFALGVASTGIFAAGSEGMDNGGENARNEAEIELNTPWAEAYYELLEEVLKDDSSKMIPTGFRLVYIDDNDVPELLIMEDSSHAAGVRVYTYYQNKVVEVGEFGSTGNMFYAEKQGKIHSYFANFGEELFSYYVLDCGKAEEIACFHSYPDLEYDDYLVTLYEIDGESVTEETINQWLAPEKPVEKL